MIFGKQGTLLLCPSSRDILDSALETARDPLYTILPMEQARMLALELDEADIAPQRNNPLSLLSSAFA